jgi:hypothetical protein
MEAANPHRHGAQRAGRAIEGNKCRGQGARHRRSEQEWGGACGVRTAGRPRLSISIPKIILYIILCNLAQRNIEHGLENMKLFLFFKLK